MVHHIGMQHVLGTNAAASYPAYEPALFYNESTGFETYYPAADNTNTTYSDINGVGHSGEPFASPDTMWQQEVSPAFNAMPAKTEINGVRTASNLQPAVPVNAAESQQRSAQVQAQLVQQSQRLDLFKAALELQPETMDAAFEQELTHALAIDPLSAEGQASIAQLSKQQEQLNTDKQRVQVAMAELDPEAAGMPGHQNTLAALQQREAITTLLLSAASLSPGTEEEQQDLLNSVRTMVAMDKSSTEAQQARALLTGSQNRLKSAQLRLEQSNATLAPGRVSGETL